MLEEVVLVNEKDEDLGTMEKIAAHEKAVLHRAFSVFIFNKIKIFSQTYKLVSTKHNHIHIQ